MLARGVDAESAVAAMNATPVKCKRRRKCFDELWTVRVLQGFTWDDLTSEYEVKIRSRRVEKFVERNREQVSFLLNLLSRYARSEGFYNEPICPCNGATCLIEEHCGEHRARTGSLQPQDPRPPRLR